jgi:oligopeptide/dipeptide ABC transporter ATP-binding protein
MYASRIVETAPIVELIDAPGHPYSRDLQQSLPSLYESKRKLAVIPGMPPMLSRIPSGCAYHPRCSMSNGTTCVTETPVLEPTAPGRASACHRRAELGMPAVRTADAGRVS